MAVAPTGATSEPPLVSCLCVTENRVAFMPWLLRAYDCQKYPNRELVVIDSSEPPLTLPGRKNARVIPMPRGTGISSKRNRALEEARGDIVAWFDDDDWQHPDRLQLLVHDLHAGSPYAGPFGAWFIDVPTLQCRRYVSRNVIFNGAVFWKEVAGSIGFDVRLPKGEDTAHLTLVLRKWGPGKTVPETLFSWLCHESNISNPRRFKRFYSPLTEVESSVGPIAWSDTAAALEALQTRLASTSALACTL